MAVGRGRFGTVAVSVRGGGVTLVLQHTEV